jgi:hypothetical protein
MDIKTVMSVILFGWETLSLTLREEHRLCVFENTVLRRIFGPKMEGDVSWEKVHNDEVHGLSSSNKIFSVTKSGRMRLAGYLTYVGEARSVCMILVGRPEGKRTLGRSRRR